MRTEWKALEKDFKTKTALEVRMKELLQEPKIIED